MTRRTYYDLPTVVANNPEFGSVRWLADKRRALGLGSRIRGRWWLTDSDIEQIWEAGRATPTVEAPDEPVLMRPTEGSLRRRRVS